MGIRNKQPESKESPELLIALTSWATDDPDGRPIVILEGERFRADSWVAKRFTTWLADASLSSWEIERLSSRVKGHTG